MFISFILYNNSRSSTRRRSDPPSRPGIKGSLGVRMAGGRLYQAEGDTGQPVETCRVEARANYTHAGLNPQAVWV
jgi:hypothetical protein